MKLINTTVIMSDALHFDNELPINPYYADESINSEVANAEHVEIATMLKNAGVTIIHVDSPADSQDGVYTANWALTRGKNAVLARLPNARKAEEAWAEQVLASRGYHVFRAPKGTKFSGQGDALPCGDYLFCGSSYRSDLEAQAYAAETLGYKRIQLRCVPLKDVTDTEVINDSSGWPDSFYYDIDLALAVISGPSENSLGTIAYCPEAFVPESQEVLKNLQDFEKIIVSEKEARQAFACNLVSTGQSVVMSADAPELKAELEKRDLTVFTPKISELVKGGGYIRCTTLSLNE